MEGNPAEFEAIGNRLGFQIVDDSDRMLKLAWRGARFPAFLCLGIALALMFISVPIIEAIRLRGFVGSAGSLWYFPAMNLVLFGISLYLISLKRTTIFDDNARQVILIKESLFRKIKFLVRYSEVQIIQLGIDQVYSGFAVAGSSAAQSFPVPSLRLKLSSDHTVLLDRGGVRRLKPLAERLSQRLGKPLAIESSLQSK
jgi:hypothetical protein